MTPGPRRLCREGSSSSRRGEGLGAPVDAAMVRELRVDSFYPRLRAAATAAGAASSTPLLILPSAADADSLCALRVLAHVLSADSIRFSVYPVASAAAAAELLASSFPADQPLCLLLINWGAHRDLRAAVLPRAATAFIVDSHRPIHLHNLCAANDRVVVLFTADDERAADLSYDFDVSSLADASDLDAPEDHRAAADSEDSDSDASSDSDDDEDGDGGRRAKRRRLSDDDDPARVFAKLRREYYRLGTFHGKPSGCLMYDLAHALRRNTTDLLWLACVALTDQFVHDRITNERYQAAVAELEQHVNDGSLDPAAGVVTLKDGTRIRAPEASRRARARVAHRVDSSPPTPSRRTDTWGAVGVTQAREEQVEEGGGWWSSRIRWRQRLHGKRWASSDTWVPVAHVNDMWVPQNKTA